MTQIRQICQRRGGKLTAVIVTHQLPRLTLCPLETWLNRTGTCLYLFTSCSHTTSTYCTKASSQKVLTLSSSSPLLSPCVVQMEEVIARMQDEKNGIPIRTVKSFLTKIPSVFSGKVFISLLCSVVIFSLFFLSFPLLSTPLFYLAHTH